MAAINRIDVPKHQAEDWAYLAGLLDGEAHLGYSDQGRSLRMTVNMTHEKTIRWLGDNFAGIVYYKPAPTNKPRNKDQWSWRVSRRADIRYILSNVRPYLITKRDQADLMLAYLDHLDATPKAVDVRLLRNLREMNRRGFQASS